jgi:GT2 family glycosyltransferase
MNRNEHHVAIIMINYNSSQYTTACIESIIEKTSPEIDYQIIVVDNNSCPEQYAALGVLKRFHQVTIVRSRINTGFAGGNMFGLQFAAAEFYFFLNNDCLLLNDCVSRLYEFCKRHPNVGICTGEMYDENMDFECSFRYFPTIPLKLLGSGLLRLFNPSAYPSRHKRYTQPLKVDSVTGSALFVNGQYFAELGGFDTNYFLYCEEEDICLRMNRAEHDVYMVPDARFQHLGGGSTIFNIDIRQEFFISFLYYVNKHYGLLYRLVMQVFLFLKLSRKSIKDFAYFRLAWRVLSGCHMRHSLRFRQKIDDQIYTSKGHN